MTMFDKADEEAAALLMKPGRSVAPSLTTRARRRREEAVRRLVADVQSKTTEHDWLVASTVAAALEKGLDRDLHTELVQEAKDNAGRIGQVCHDHADVFLSSVAQIAALAEPAAELADGIKENHRELKNATAGPMQQANARWEAAQQSYARAKTLHVMVDACQRVAIQLERARKQANLGRPKSALDAVDQARYALTTPVESLFEGNERELWKATTSANQKNDEDDDHENAEDANKNREKLVSLEQTPFGNRASIMLPKIENEVLMSAKRGLNRWFMALRNGGEAAKIGRVILRQCAYAQALGPGRLGLGGTLPPSYMWRSKAADNSLARVDVSGKVGRSLRMGYFCDRDAPKEAERLEKSTKEGLERRVEAIVTAFGFYRCWDESAPLLVEPAEFAELVSNMDSSNRSRVSTSGSRHGTSGSRHGLRGSRHGKGRSLGFRASTSSRSQAYQDISSTLGAAANLQTGNLKSRWVELFIPDVLQEGYSGRKEEELLLLRLPESVHPVRRAELAFSLLGRSDEFVAYYESNRFGETKLSGEGVEKARTSYLSALTGDDISVGTDRIFYAKTLPHLCASVMGFCAIEAALEYGNFSEKEGEATSSSMTRSGINKQVSMSSGGFRESSEAYERSLIGELGSVCRSRSVNGQLCELVRASVLLSIFRGALKISHPSSTSRRFDKDLLSVDKNILTIALKVANDEQLRVSAALSYDDQKVPMLVSDAPTRIDTRQPAATLSGIPDPEIEGLPFGLSELIQKPSQVELDFQDQARTSFNRAPLDEAFTFSPAVPQVIRSLHARSIALAVFALSQVELGQSFPDKKCCNAAAYVLDGVDGLVTSTAMGLKDSDNVAEEGSVEKAVQVMANISALQRCLPRFFGCLIRGMCNIGLIRSDEVDATLAYSERVLKSSDKACDAQVGSMYSLVYEICRNKIDSHMNLALENFQWVAKSERDMPNAYCEGLIGYLRSVFASLGPMDEGSRAGLHFSCCGHVAEKLVKLLSGKPGDTATFDDSSLPPITRIDAFGIKNLFTDCQEFERFADTTGVPQLRDCFNELRILTTFMLDKELPLLLLPENSTSRRRKYPILSMDKVLSMLEKYQGTGLGDKLMGGSRSSDFLFIDKKEVTQLIKIARSQTIQ